MYTMGMVVSLYGHVRCVQDTVGENYWAVILDPDQAALDASWACLEQHGLGEAVARRHARDGAKTAHVTLYNVAEWGGLLKYAPEKREHVEALEGRRVTLELHGVGKAVSKNEQHTAWFGVLTCSELAELREQLGHKPRDFHVTLAFSAKDVFDAKKDMSSLSISLQEVLTWMPYQGPTP